MNVSDTRANLSICCFQEVRRLKKDSIFIPIMIDDETTSWNVWWSGYECKREHGVGIAVKSCKLITIESISQISPRVMFIDCIVYGIKLRVVRAYDNKRQLLICGDMNATADYGKSFVGGKTCIVHNPNNNGTRFAEFLNNSELSLANT